VFLCCSIEHLGRSRGTALPPEMRGNVRSHLLGLGESGVNRCPIVLHHGLNVVLKYHLSALQQNLWVKSRIPARQCISLCKIVHGEPDQSSKRLQLSTYLIDRICQEMQQPRRASACGCKWSPAGDLLKWFDRKRSNSRDNRSGAYDLGKRSGGIALVAWVWCKCMGRLQGVG